MSPALPLKKAGDFARQAEEAGFGALYFTESGRTAYLSCASAGLATKKIKIGTAVALAFTRSPMVTAQIAWELADLTEGRFVLGLGTQVKAHIERRYGMEFSPPGPRMKDYVGAIKACFDAFSGRSKLNYESEFVNLTLLPPQWNPGPLEHMVTTQEQEQEQPAQVPIFLSAVLPYMCRLVGSSADGIHIHPFHSPEYVTQKVIPEIEAGAKQANRKLEDVTLEIHTMTATGDTKEEIAMNFEHARTMIAFYGTTPAYAPVFKQHGFDNMTQALRDMQKAGKQKEMVELITDEVLENFCVSASYSELADVLYERYAGLGKSVRVMTYSAANQWAKDPSSLQKWAGVVEKLRSLG